MNTETPTPRTDAFNTAMFEKYMVLPNPCPMTAHARQLERELIKATSIQKFALDKDYYDKYQTLCAENDQLRSVVDIAVEQLLAVTDESGKADILCEDKYTMSYSRGSALHVKMIAAINLYNNLPHVKEKQK